MMDDVEFTPEELAVDELRSTGADMSARRRVDHYLYLPTRMQADSVAEEARRLGFEAAIDLDEQTHDWLVLATHEIVVSVHELTRLRERFEALTAVYGGEYAGSDIVPDHVDEDEEDWRTFDPSRDYEDEQE